ncbi:hypothetical protein OPV22_006861 [Ensete ventricosum]|uniref:Secreted protein n=1 Tax=Ensete ventricosum TaxID=4639 RepID=A0AAV8RFZ8_ENSVE|nr:hypothetical protein OPV22_006861 [Ensete ventricosum]
MWVWVWVVYAGVNSFASKSPGSKRTPHVIPTVTLGLPRSDHSSRDQSRRSICHVSTAAWLLNSTRVGPAPPRLCISDTLGLAALCAPFLESTSRDRDRSSGRGIQVRGSERRVAFPKIWILGRIGRPNLFFFGHELIRGS